VLPVNADHARVVRRAHRHLTAVERPRHDWNCDRHHSRETKIAQKNKTERGGFEPPVRFPAHSISSAAQSTTLSPLLKDLPNPGKGAASPAAAGIRSAEPPPHNSDFTTLFPGKEGNGIQPERPVEIGNTGGEPETLYFLPPLEPGGAFASDLAFALGFLSSFTFFTPAFFSAFLAAT
jgi:hypothetical protein